MVKIAGKQGHQALHHRRTDHILSQRGGRQQEKALCLPAGVNGLCRSAPGKDHVGYIEHQVLFRTGHAVQASQARVAIHQQNTAAPLGQSPAQPHRQSGFAHTALSRRDDCCYTHKLLYLGYHLSTLPANCQKQIDANYTLK